MKSKKKNKIIRNSQVIFRDVEGVVYILDPSTGTIHTLNETASFLWRVLDKPKTMDSLVAEMCEAFDVESSIANKDVSQFVTGYITRGFLRLR